MFDDMDALSAFIPWHMKSDNTNSGVKTKLIIKRGAQSFARLFKFIHGVLGLLFLYVYRISGKPCSDIVENDIQSYGKGFLGIVAHMRRQDGVFRV